MIKYIKKIWKWIKEKTKRFGKAILVILGIGSAFAAGNQMIPNDSIVIYKDVKELVPIERQGKYVASERNYDSIQFEELRKQIDYTYSKAHDALSAAYYEEYEFVWNGKNYGILDKETFDKLQTMLWARYEVLFHQENVKRGIYSESDYNDILDKNGNIVGKKTDKALKRIQELQNQGIDINL